MQVLALLALERPAHAVAMHSAYGRSSQTICQENVLGGLLNLCRHLLQRTSATTPRHIVTHSTFVEEVVVDEVADAAGLVS